MLTYNRAEYINKAIDSILGQTYQDWELFVIDDGSKDGTRAIMKFYTDPRIHYIHHDDNQGLIIRRSESLTYSHGKYVAILDSDDLWIDSGKLENQVNYMEAHPSTVVIGTHASIINSRGEKIGSYANETKDAKIRRRILLWQQFAHSSILMRKSALDKTSGYKPLSQAEDYDLCLTLGNFGTFTNIPKEMTAYRVHEGNTSKQRYKMALNTLRVLWSHRKEYPNFILGALLGLLRIVKSVI